MSDDTRLHAGANPFYYHRPILTRAQREEIVSRYLDGETSAALSQEFGVSRATIRTYVPRRS